MANDTSPHEAETVWPNRPGLSAFAFHLLALCVLTAMCGCGGVGTIHGTITFGGEPLPAGLVTFLGANGRTASVAIKSDGTYSINNFPVGKVTILVDSQPSRPWVDPFQYMKGTDGTTISTEKISGVPDIKPPKRGKHVRIPEKFNNIDESALTYTVHRGEQTYDIDLSAN